MPDEFDMDHIHCLAACPVCAGPMNKKILVCASCWMTLPEHDRYDFRAAFQRGIRLHTTAPFRARANELVRRLRSQRKPELGRELAPPAPVSHD